MFNDDLPEFDERDVTEVLPLMKSVFGDHIARLETFDDGHFRVVFQMAYFTLHEGATEPTKSQWSSLKKRIKRRDRLIFIFKETGEIQCSGAENGVSCYFIDFGFFLG